MKTWKKVIGITLTVILSYCILSLLSVAVICDGIFNRDYPVASFCYSYEEVAESVSRETVILSDGAIAYYYEAQASRGLIVYTGGLGSAPDTHLPETLYFLGHGWSVLLPDGVRAVDGDIGGFPAVTETVRAAVAYARSTPALRNQPLMLLGHSAGGYATACALNGTDGICAAVTLCAFDRPVATMADFASRYVGVLSDLGAPFIRLHQQSLFGSQADVSAAEAVRNSAVPTMVIEAEADAAIPAHLGIARCLADCPHVTLVTVPRRGHSDLLMSDEALLSREIGGTKSEQNSLDAALMARILDFFEQNRNGE